MWTTDVLAQGLRDQNSLYVEGGGSRQVFETLDRANYVVKCHLHSIARLLNVERVIRLATVHGQASLIAQPS